MKLLDRLRDRLRPPIRGRLVFLHVPKCGGTSIRQGIEESFKPWRSTQQGSVRNLIEDAAREAGVAGRVPDGGLRKALLAYDLATSRARLLSGHYRYSRAVFERYRDSWSFLTVLRHPVARWYSHFHFNTATPPGDMYHISLPLEQYIESERAPRHGTALVRSFADMEDEEDDRSDDSVRRAIENLRELDLVGTLEDLPGFRAAFQARFGAPLDIPRLNVTRRDGKASRVDVEPWIDERVRRFCEPDLKVFRALFPEIAESRDTAPRSR